MTKTHLQNLRQQELIQMAIELRICVPSNFLENRQIQADFCAERSELQLDSKEREELIDEVFEVLVEQHSESLNDLTLPLWGSLHKFELEQDRASGRANPLPFNYLVDRLGLTKNKLHLILRDMEWAVIFWQLSTSIKNKTLQEERRLLQVHNNQTYDGEDSNLSIVVHESPAMPQFAHQSKLTSFHGSCLHNYYQENGNSETHYCSFSVGSDEYKRYVYLHNGCNYYWAELYHYNSEYCRHVLLARSLIIFKPELFELSPLPVSASKEEQAAHKLYELSNSIPET